MNKFLRFIVKQLDNTQNQYEMILAFRIPLPDVNGLIERFICLFGFDILMAVNYIYIYIYMTA